jgi:hypothetical protein
MAANPDVAVREALAGNLHTPADALAKLAKDEDVAVRRAVAANTMAWKNTLLALTRDEEPSVLKAVAGNDSAPPSALRKLANYTGTAEEPNESVKRAVARNHGTPQDVLAALAANEQPMSVRIEVASNENAGAKLLTTLCSDPSPQIRAEVADNVASPPEVLARLLSDPSPAVQAAAFKTSRLVDLGQAAERESDPLKASALREAALKLKDSDFIATLERRSGRSLVDNSGILMSIGLLGVVALDSAAAILRRTQGDRYSLPTLGVEQN